MIPGTLAVTDDPQPVALTLGAFDLVGEGATWLSEALSEGTDLAGNPVSVEVAIQTLIQDGSVSYTEKYDNATIPIKVCLSGPDAEALDDGAAALFAELGKPNVLTYLGPQAASPIAWDVVNSHLERNSDDMEEVRGKRYYTVTLSVLPFRRRTTETITEALLPDGSTTTLVNDASSGTGWTGVPAPVTASGGTVSVTGPDQTGFQALWLTLAGPVSMAGLPYLIVDWKATSQSAPGILLNPSSDGANPGEPKVGEMPSPIAGYTRTWFLPLANSLSRLQFVAGTTWDFGLPIPSRDFVITNVAITNQSPGLPKQRVRSIAIGGSARTPGAIAIEHEATALGDVMAFFWPDDGTLYAPPCYPYRISGSGLVSDANAITATHENINGTARVYDIPATRVPREGYLLVARVGGTATGALTWTITTRVNGVDLGPTITGSRALAVSGAFQFCTLAAVQLPTRDLDEAGAGAMVRISLIGDADFALDEVLIYRDSGQLIGPIVCGTGSPSAGGPSNRVFIEPPNLSRPRPVVRRGHAADRSDSFHPPSMGAWEFPEFKPERVLSHVITTNVGGAAVSFRHYERLAG